MEVDPKQRSSYPWLIGNGSLQHRHDNVIGLGTRELIKFRKKAKRPSTMTTPANIEARVSWGECGREGSYYYNTKSNFEELHWWFKLLLHVLQIA